MGSAPDEVSKAVLEMWFQELGGKLKARLLDELYGSKEPLPEEPELFEASKQKFLAAGKTAIEHRVWRQSELKRLRLAYLEHLTWNLNREHPYFSTEEDIDELDAVLPTGQQPIREPNISLYELDEEVTDWYLQKEAKTSSTMPEEIKTATPSNEPAPLADTRGTHGAPEPVTSATTPSNDNSSPIHHDSGKDSWRFINNEDLEGEEMDANAVCKIIHKLLLTEGGGKTKHTHDSIKKSLKSAQCDASAASKRHNNRMPVRLRGESAYYFELFAMITIAPRGRLKKGERGTLYKSIKASIWKNDEKENASAEPSCEPLQG